MASSIDQSGVELVEVLRLDGEQIGVGLLAIQMFEVLRRLGVLPVAHVDGELVTHAQLRDTIDEVLAEANVTVVYTRRNP